MSRPLIDCSVLDLGLIDYAKAFEVQKRCVQDVIERKRLSILIFCQHPAVITFGRSGHPENLLVSDDKLKSMGVKVLNIDRGGDVTLHAPGQWVVYPILDLTEHGKDLHRYLTSLEAVGIDLLKNFGILAHRILGKTGVYVGDDKVMSIGVGVRRWISYHGLAINIDTDLKYFSLINPCGLGVKMTSLSALKGQRVDMQEVKERLIGQFCHEFQLNVIEEKAEMLNV